MREFERNVYILTASKKATSTHKYGYGATQLHYNKKGKFLAKDCFSTYSLESLIEKFVNNGWRISNKDIVKTISPFSPIIINMFDEHPWNKGYSCLWALEKGEMQICRALTPEEMNEFYIKYQKLAAKLDKKSAQIA